MSITADDYRALARSSPWLWRSIELVWNDGPRVWLQRPARCVVEGTRLERLEESAGGHRAWGFAVLDDRRPVDTKALLESVGKVGFVADAEPVRRPDGLVSLRPAGIMLTAPSQPMVDGYFSVAAVDPVELSEHVGFFGVRTETWRGRETWVARCVALPGYEPRCGCCALLFDRRIAELEFGPEAVEGKAFADDVEIWLDRRTGVVTRWLPNGGDKAPVEVEIVEVDGDFDAVWARATPR